MEKTKKVRVLISVVAISLLQGLQYCVSPVLGQIEEHFPQASRSAVQLLVTMPGLLALIFALASGWLVTRISKKKLLLAAALIAGVTGFLPLAADSFALLFACRAVYGVTLGLAMSLNTAVIADFFEGEERVAAMGIQAASVGAGMMLVMYLSGLLGASRFTGAYWINIIGFLALAVLILCLPDTGRAEVQTGQRLHVGGHVFVMALFGALEFCFLITFTTQIAMHLSGIHAGDSKTAGLLTALFSGIQIVAGMLLTRVTRITGKYTLTAALVSLALGCLLVAFFPGSQPLLILGALFFGFSQGIFIPTGMVESANAVAPEATALSAAVFSCGLCAGSLLSPVLLNPLAGLLFSADTTANVYLLAASGAALSAVAAAVWKHKS